MIRRIGFLTFAVLFFAGATFLAAGRSDVADAAMKHDRAALRALIQQKADVNAPQVDGATAVHWAVYNDDSESADLLIKAGAKVDIRNREGITPLHLASQYGNAAMIDRLIKAGADAKQRGPAGETMVMLAARSGNPQAIRLLVAAGADVNAKERIRGTTALMWAVEQRHPEAVAALLEAKADFSAKSGAAGLPRNYMAPRLNPERVQQANRVRANAATNGRTYEEELAVESANGTIAVRRIGDFFGARQQAAAGQGQGAGAQAAGRGGQASAGAPDIQAIARQVIEFSGQFGANPLEAVSAFASQLPAGVDVNALTKAIQDILNQGGRGARPQAGQRARAAAVPEAEDEDDTDVVVAGLVGSGGGGLTSLVLAAREGDLESSKLLLEAGADVNQTTEYGWTPLLTATNNRHYKLAEFLIEHGADVNKSNKGKWTPLYLATDNRNIEGGDFPVPKPDIDHLELIKFLLDHGANPNLQIKDNTLTRTIFTMQWFVEGGATPFIRAAQSSDLEVMRLLLAHGADPLIKTDLGDTALTAAAGMGWVDGVTYEHSAKENVQTVKFLLDLGLDPNAANNDGRTSLMVAAAKGRTEVIQILVDHGAKLDTRDKGSRDTDTLVSKIAGHTWEALDYADGLVRFGVQSAVARPEAAALLRKLMTERGLPVPPANRIVDSICIVEICKERIWN
jgi:ankyrin repeat protein